MTDYLNSLAKVRDRGFATLWPTHGPPIGRQFGRDVGAFVQAFIDHRLEREAQIVAQLATGQRRIKDMVAVIYADVDKRLHPAACHSVLAHIIRLVEQGRVGCEGPPCVDNEYWLKHAA
jgi:glyoxylase-like metal-dependent hydrolase (beta-lactamase superfamily II)